jgi:Putative beta-barrel porin-2, OmpL-like. bbp2
MGWCKEHAAVYLNVDPQDWFGLTLRSEMFNDKDALKGFNSSLFVNTLSANFKVEGFTFIPEIRIESADNKIYADKVGAFTKKGAASFLLAAVYKF